MSIILRREYDFGTITLDTADQRDARHGEAVFGVNLNAGGAGPASALADGDVDEDIAGFGDLDAAERSEVIEALRDLAGGARALLALPAGDADINRERVVTLCREAGSAGDSEMILICQAALLGYGPARAECERVIANARAMVNED